MSSSTAVFDALPGLETPVADVRRALAAVWDMEPSGGKPAPAEFRASQMNLVIHFGLDTTPEEAGQGFANALNFSRRYPCRIIALCPRPRGGGGDVSAKIFCECYIGKSQHDMTCSEAIALTYPLEQRVYLESQATIMLESDLPLYYWPQHIRRATNLGDYTLFLNEAHRIVIDSAVEKAAVLKFKWPRPEAVRDLVFARLLPVRQQAGHFLSYIDPKRIVDGLEGIAVTYGGELKAEAGAFASWIERGIADCATAAGSEIKEPVVAEIAGSARANQLCAEWKYSDGGVTLLKFDFEKKVSHLESSRAAESNTITGAARLLEPDSTLAEALFF